MRTCTSGGRVTLRSRRWAKAGDEGEEEEGVTETRGKTGTGTETTGTGMVMVPGVAVPVPIVPGSDFCGRLESPEHSGSTFWYWSRCRACAETCAETISSRARPRRTGLGSRVRRRPRAVACPSRRRRRRRASVDFSIRLSSGEAERARGLTSRPRALHPTRALFLRERRHRVRRVRSRHAASRRIAARRRAETRKARVPRRCTCSQKTPNATTRATTPPPLSRAPCERRSTRSSSSDSRRLRVFTTRRLAAARALRQFPFPRRRARDQRRGRAAFRFASPRITPFVSTRSVGWRWGMATRVSSRRWRSVDRGRRGRSGGNRARCSPSRRTIGSS